MKKTPLYITLGIIGFVLIAFLCYFLYTGGNGKKTDLPTDTAKVKKVVVPPIKVDTVFVNPEVPAAKYHWTPEVADFTLEDAERMTKSIYDTVKVEKQAEMEDSTEREFSNVVFFSQDDVLHAIVVVENRGPMCGACVGWCDVLAFVKKNNKWILSDFMLQAGGGGMYGNPGELQRLEQIGNQTVGIILQGGQEHMGGNYHEDVIAIHEGKLESVVNISIHHDYGTGAGDDFKTTVCDENKFKFIPNGRAWFDLEITRYNCLGEDNKKVKTQTIPFRNGYEIPAAFQFEG
jgi:hypothetical protein